MIIKYHITLHYKIRKIILNDLVVHATHKALFLYSGAVASHSFSLAVRALIYSSAHPVGTHSSAFSMSDPLYLVLLSPPNAWVLQTEEAPVPINNR